MNESAEIDFGTTQNLPKLPKNRTEDLPVISQPIREQSKSVMHRQISRRTVVKGAVAGAVAIGTGVPLYNHLSHDESQRPTSEDSNIISTIHTAIEEELHDPWAEQNAILQAELFTPERVALENAYLKEEMTLSEIDLGLTVCVEENVRRTLIEKRWELRKSGAEGMTKLSEKQIQFCSEHGITPEILGMCLDTYDDAKNIIAQLQGELRDDQEGKTVDPEMLMINAGGLAKLIMTETTGFTDVGGVRKKKAITEFGENEAYDLPALQELTANLSEETGLRFDYKNIAGSEFLKQDGNTSGGAIGIQFMPSRALEYYRELKKAGEIGNIFDPIQSIKMAWTFLACHEWVGPKENDFRWGYMKGRTEENGAIEKSLRKWNNKTSQMESIRDAAYDYSDTIISQGTP